MTYLLRHGKHPSALKIRIHNKYISSFSQFEKYGPSTTKSIVTYLLGHGKHPSALYMIVCSGTPHPGRADIWDTSPMENTQKLCHSTAVYVTFVPWQRMPLELQVSRKWPWNNQHLIKHGQGKIRIPVYFFLYIFNPFTTVAPKRPCLF